MSCSLCRSNPLTFPELNPNTSRPHQLTTVKSLVRPTVLPVLTLPHHVPTGTTHCAAGREACLPQHFLRSKHLLSTTRICCGSWSVRSILNFIRIAKLTLYLEQRDLVIIGGGVAGYVAAIKAGQAGLKVRKTSITTPTTILTSTNRLLASRSAAPSAVPA